MIDNWIRSLQNIYKYNFWPNERYISFNNTTLKDAIIQLEQKSNRPFYFIENWFEGITITKSYKNKSLQFILNDLLQNSSVNFFIY